MGGLKWAFDPETAASVTAAVAEQRQRSHFPLRHHGKEKLAESSSCCDCIIKIHRESMTLLEKIER